MGSTLALSQPLYCKTIRVIGEYLFLVRPIIIPHVSQYDDLILFRGDFYVVDRTGRAVLVGLSLDMSLVAESICDCGIQKFLVESSGGLLLVDVYLSFGDVDGGDIDEVFDIF